jgi:MFS family permease
MLGSNLARAATVGVVAMLVLADSVELWHLVALGIVFGTVDSIFFPALNTIVPMLVPADRLPAANAVVQGTSQLTSLVGPAVAGVLVAAIGTGTAFTLDALSFGVAALALMLIRGGRRTTKAAAADQGTADPAGAVAEPSLVRSIRDGAAYAFRDPGIRSIILLSAAVNLGTSGSIAVGLPWLANVRFDGGPALLGILFAGFGAGALAGAVVAGTAAHPKRFGLVVLALAAGLGLGIAALGVAPNAAVAIAILVLTGVTAGYLNVTIIAWLQARAEPALLGRVMSLVMLGAVGLQPVSLALAGILVDAHATAMYLAAGAVILAAAAAGLLGGAQRALD